MATLRGGTQAPRTFVTVPKEKDVLRETVVPTDTAHAWPALPGGSTDVGVRTRGIGVQCCPWNILLVGIVSGRTGADYPQPRWI